MTRAKTKDQRRRPRASPQDTTSQGEASGGGSYTIDELAAKTGVPSRTIRFYQSKGALAKPEIRGRVAYYDESHVERLALIAELQDKGLSIRAIRDLLEQIDKGAITLNEWLGIEAQFQKPWLDDQPKLMPESELDALCEHRRPGLIGDLLRNRLIERQGDQYLVASPRLLEITLAFEAAGISVDTSAEGAAIMRKYMQPMAKDLVKLYIDRLGDELPEDHPATAIANALNSLRPYSVDAVQVLFSHAIESVLRDLVERGGVADLKSKRGKK